MPDNGRMPFNWKYLKRRREELELTQAQMAKAAGMSNAAKWSQYERGELLNPELRTLEKMARALKCDVPALLTTPAKPKRPKKGM